MAVQDYTEFTEVVDELVDEFGRTVSFLKKSRAVVDTDEPWDAPAAWNDSSPPADHKVTTKAISVGMIRSTLQGEAVAQAMASLIQMRSDGFLTKGPAALGVSLDDFTSIQDGEETWRINNVYGPNPGDTVLFYWVEVAS